MLSAFAISLHTCTSTCATATCNTQCAHMQGGDSGTYPGNGQPEPNDTSGIQRFALVLQGTVQLYQDAELPGVAPGTVPAGTVPGFASASNHTEGAWVFCPGNGRCNLQDVSGDAAMLIVERLPVDGHAAPDKVLVGDVQDSPVLDTGASLYRAGATILPRASCCRALISKSHACTCVCILSTSFAPSAQHADAVLPSAQQLCCNVAAECGRSLLISPHFVSTLAAPHAPRAEPEMFALRKLLPATPEYVFNMHVMDFAPGEHLVTHEVHYNTHGLLMLQGQGVYRLNEDWHPVKAGDAIWMAPYVPQWFAALGKSPARYIIYKDTTLDPLHSK